MNPNRRHLLRALPALLASAGFTGFAEDPAPLDFARWERDIAALEAKQAEVPPGGIVFLGSSSIRLWKLGKSWPGENVINSGFGGSMLPDSVHFFERLVVPRRPRALVVYAGDNDIGKGRSAAQVVADFAALAGKMRASLPGVPLVYVAIKPSVKRWNLWPEMKRANEGIAAICADDASLHFADIAAPMLEGAQGPPDKAWFAADGLHLSPTGYARWTEVVTAVLREAGALR